MIRSKYILFVLSFLFLACKDDKPVVIPPEITAKTPTTDETSVDSTLEDESSSSSKSPAEPKVKPMETKNRKDSTSPLKDSDGDGIVDLADRCPTVKGKACLQGCQESDNDCIPDEIDKCPLQDGLPVNQGCPERIDKISETITYYYDSDGDGLGDPAKTKESSVKLSNYVTNSDDNCPTRKGSDEEKGCPEVDIIGTKDKDLYFLNEALDFTVRTTQKTSDQYYWYSSGNVLIDNASTKKSTFTFSSVGKHTIQLEIKNEGDGYYSGKVIKEINVGIKENDFANLFKPLITYGNYAILDGKKISTSEKVVLSDNLKRQYENSKIRLLSLVHNESIGIYKKGLVSNTFDKLLDELLAVKRKNTTQIEGIKVANIKYDDNSGKISAFDYELF